LEYEWHICNVYNLSIAYMYYIHWMLPYTVINQITRLTLILYTTWFLRKPHSLRLSIKTNIEVFSVIWAPQGTHNIEVWPSVSVAGYKPPKWGYITCSYDATEMSSQCTEKTSHNEQIVVRTDHWWSVGREKCHTLLIIASLSCDNMYFPVPSFYCLYTCFRHAYSWMTAN
jgi:hypothetical protein